MKRKPIKAHRLLWVIIAVGFLAGVLLYSKLPEQIPVHWNLAGEVDRYGSRFEGAFMVPVINAALLLLLIWLPAVDPKRKNYEKFEGFYKIIQWTMVIFLTGMQILVLSWGLGHHLSISFFAKIGIGFLFIILGNYLGKVLPNWFVGIRNPWTLENEEVWVKTHRMAAPLMFVAGVISLLMAFVSSNISFWIIIIVVAIAALVPSVYSYILYHKLMEQCDPK
jgi:uncharacterized membrane protein